MQHGLVERVVELARDLAVDLARVDLVYLTANFSNKLISMRQFRFKPGVSVILLSLILAMTLAGCGNKGPLKPAEAPTPAANG